jgi:hypothetical protein
MPNQASGKTPPPPRIVNATVYRAQQLIGPIDILSYTKHGSTAVISTDPAAEALQKGDVLKTKSWVLGSRELVIVKEHQKAMKLPGVWYEVKVTPAAVKN